MEVSTFLINNHDESLTGYIKQSVHISRVQATLESLQVKVPYTVLERHQHLNRIHSLIQKAIYTANSRMNPWMLLVVAVVSLSYIGLTEGAGVLALAAGAPASLLVGLPFTLAGISSGTLAALGALKLLAATALALSYTGASLGGRGYNNYPYSGYEHQGYEQQGYGYEQQGYAGGHQVYKREAVENQLGSLDLYFHIINEVDTNSCALRLICELESTKKKGLQEDERMILGLFGPKPREVTLESLKTPSGPYHFAAYLGSTSKAEQCTKFYGRCPYNATEMMSALRTATTNKQ